MPFSMFNEVLKDKGYRPLPDIRKPKETIRIVSSDIPIVGNRGLKVLDNVGVYLVNSFPECIGCRKCEKECPERALTVYDLGSKKFKVQIATEHCLGTACKNCESVCPQKCFNFSELKIVNRG
jgi:formate hydrogenlyase subunit 6/NADH:ubiquinone oxidoreductase subunit I